MRFFLNSLIVISGFLGGHVAVAQNGDVVPPQKERDKSILHYATYQNLMNTLIYKQMFYMKKHSNILPK